MVDLPSLANNVPQVRAPTPGVSPSQVAEPYNELASTLGTVGREAGEIAKPLAERAGIEAVTRDPDGNLQVKRLPIIGPAADDFKRAVQWSALAQSSGEARRKDLELAREFPNDPAGYLKAADAFKKKYVEGVTKAAGPEVGLRLSTVIDGTTTQQYNSLLAQQQATIKHNFDRDTAAAIRDAKVDLDNLIETGGLDTPAGARQAHDLVERIRGTYRERVGNPVLSAPPEEAALAIKKLDQDIGGAMFAAKVKKTLDENPDDGLSKVEKLMDENFKDTSIPASQRVTNRDRAQDAIKSWTQDRQHEVVAAARQRKAKDDLFEDAVIRSTISGGPEITDTDIKKADVSPAVKMRMLSWKKQQDMPEPEARVSERATQDAFRRIHLPEGDPSKITDAGQIRDLYAPPDGSRGVLKRTDEEWLEKVFTQGRSPSGEALSRDRKIFLDNHATALVPGDPRTFLAIKEMQRQEDMLRAQGKDPHALYDPASPMYFGTPKNLQKYKGKLDDILKDYQQNRNLTGPGKDIVSTTIQDIPPGMSPAEVLKTYKSGTRVRLPDGRIGTVP